MYVQPDGLANIPSRTTQYTPDHKILRTHNVSGLGFEVHERIGLSDARELLKVEEERGGED